LTPFVHILTPFAGSAIAGHAIAGFAYEQTVHVSSLAML
jgi:hypothetical protein